MFKNKRGISQYMIILFSWLAFIAITLFFFLLFSISLRGCGHNKALQEITGTNMENSTADIVLLNYLRTPVELNKTNSTIADLITFYAISEYKDNELEKAIRSNTTQIFDSSEYCYKEPLITDWQIKGSCIFISEEIGEEAAPTRTNRRFCTDHFHSGARRVEMSVVKLPLKNNKFTYVHFYRSSVNSFGKKCIRYIT